VFLGYASRLGHTLIDRRIYLPDSWTGDRQRCARAGMPDEIGFATRSQLADDMITATVPAGCRPDGSPRTRPTATTPRYGPG
jgi:hypothetical protein